MENVQRKLDDTRLTFKKLPDGQMLVTGFGASKYDDRPSETLTSNQVFEVRAQDGQLATVIKEKGSPAGGEEGQACLDILVRCNELGGRRAEETLPDYLVRLIQVVTNVTAYGAAPAPGDFREPIPVIKVKAGDAEYLAPAPGYEAPGRE